MKCASWFSRRWDAMTLPLVHQHRSLIGQKEMSARCYRWQEASSRVALCERLSSTLRWLNPFVPLHAPLERGA